MNRVLLAGTIEYNIKLLMNMPIWGEKTGFSVAATTVNGREALQLLKEQRFDAVITEVELVDLDGMQLLKKISQNKLCPITVLLSDTVDFSYVRESILYGAFDFMKKMPDAAALKEVLERARRRLADEALNAHNGNASVLAVEEKQILESLLSQHGDADQLLKQTVQKVYGETGLTEVQKEVMIKELYTRVISAVFQEYRWLYQYVDMDFYHSIDYMWLDSGRTKESLFERKISHLQTLLRQLYLPTGDKNLNSLEHYVLNHPGGDLRLKEIADKMYLNAAYLSNSFSNKLGLRFNEYAVRVKMARAAYLLGKPDMKIYEVCEAIAYPDTGYFTKQFKKLYGMSPTEYRQQYETDNSLDYAFL